MKFVDDSQNLRGRLHLIQALVMVMLGVLGVRLYLLQIVNGPRYAEIAENQRIRLLPIPAPRGRIFDRNGKLLVDSQPIYTIILLRIEQTPERTYPPNGMLAHVLGYVQEISLDQLDEPRYKDKHYKPGDVIGQNGIEAVYDEYLRGRDGYRKVIVDSRGHIQKEIE